jgi:hypothetical protein
MSKLLPGSMYTAHDLKQARLLHENRNRYLSRLLCRYTLKVHKDLRDYYLNQLSKEFKRVKVNSRGRIWVYIPYTDSLSCTRFKQNYSLVLEESCVGEFKSGWYGFRRTNILRY